MKTTIFTKKDFTIADLLEQVKDCDSDAKILNGCYTPDHTASLLNLGDPKDLEPIFGFYDEGNTVTVAYTFEIRDISKTQTLADLINSIEIKKLKLTATLERDVEDGFVFSNYDHIVFNREIIVLC